MTELKKEKRELWFSRIMECRKSGLADKAWCIKNNIEPSTFYYWVKILQKESCEIPPTTKSDMTISEPQPVVPLVIASNTKPKVDIDSSTAIIIHLNNSITLEIQNCANQSAITNTINALRQLC